MGSNAEPGSDRLAVNPDWQLQSWKHERKSFPASKKAEGTKKTSGKMAASIKKLMYIGLTPLGLTPLRIDPLTFLRPSARRRRTLQRFLLKPIAGKSIRAKLLHLLAYHGNWYLLARNKAKDQVQTFALSRFRWIKATGGTFARPADFNAGSYARQAFGITGGEPPMKKANLRRQGAPLPSSTGG